MVNITLDDLRAGDYFRFQAEPAILWKVYIVETPKRKPKRVGIIPFTLDMKSNVPYFGDQEDPTLPVYLYPQEDVEEMDKKNRVKIKSPTRTLTFHQRKDEKRMLIFAQDPTTSQDTGGDYGIWDFPPW